jgi:hypothetical protein
VQITPQTRGSLTLTALAVLFFAFVWFYPDHPWLFIACFVACWVLIYIAGGGRLPWKIKLRSYAAYILISLGVVGLALLIALYEAHKTR